MDIVRSCCWNVFPMFRAAIFAAIIVCGFFCLETFRIGCAAAAGITTDDVFRAWSERQEKVHSLRFSIRHESQLPSSAGSKPAADEESSSDSPSAVLVEVQILGNRFDFRQNPVADGPPGLLPQLRSSFDGIQSQQYNAARAIGGAPSLAVRKGGPAFDVDRMVVRPILLVYRPLSPLGRIHKEEYALVAEPQIIENVSCVGLEETAKKMRKQTIWVDPVRDYVPVRYESKVEGREIVTLDIHYRDQLPWAPDKWNYRFHGNDASTSPQGHDVVTNFEINAE